jgi:hypothetical protein
MGIWTRTLVVRLKCTPPSLPPLLFHFFLSSLPTFYAECGIPAFHESLITNWICVSIDVCGIKETASCSSCNGNVKCIDFLNLIPVCYTWIGCFWMWRQYIVLWYWQDLSPCSNSSLSAYLNTMRWYSSSRFKDSIS